MRASFIRTSAKHSVGGPAGPGEVREQGSAQPEMYGNCQCDDYRETDGAEVEISRTCCGFFDRRGRFAVGAVAGSFQPLPVQCQWVAVTESVEVAGDDILDSSQVFLVGGLDVQV